MSWDSNHPSNGGATVNFDLRSGDDDELKKQQADLQLMNDLLTRGYSPDAATYIVKKRRETGQVDLDMPSYSNAVIPSGQQNRPVALPPAPDIPERSTIQNFAPMTSGQNIYVDARDGHEIRREPNGGKANKVIKIGSATPASSTPKPTPAQQAALSYVKDWYKQWREGTADPEDPVLPSMAKGIGLDISEIPSVDNPTPSPSFIQKVFGIEPDKPAPTPGKKFPVYPGKGGDLNSRAADYLKRNGQKTTPANIKHAIDLKWVK